MLIIPIHWHILHVWDLNHHTLHQLQMFNSRLPFFNCFNQILVNYVKCSFFHSNLLNMMPSLPNRTICTCFVVFLVPLHDKRMLKTFFFFKVWDDCAIFSRNGCDKTYPNFALGLEKVGLNMGLFCAKIGVLCPHGGR